MVIFLEDTVCCETPYTHDVFSHKLGRNMRQLCIGKQSEKAIIKYMAEKQKCQVRDVNHPKLGTLLALVKEIYTSSEWKSSLKDVEVKDFILMVCFLTKSTT